MDAEAGRLIQETGDRAAAASAPHLLASFSRGNSAAHPEEFSAIDRALAQAQGETDAARARAAGEEAERRAVAAGYAGGIVEALRLQARLILAGDHAGDAALPLLHRALDLARANDDSALEGRCLSDLAAVYDRRGEPALAIEHYLRAREAQRTSGDRRALSTTLNGAGTVYCALGDYRNGLTFFAEALDVARETEDAAAEAAALHHIAQVRTELGEAHAALPTGLEALRLSRETPLRPLEIAILHTLGRQYAALRRFDEAEDAFEASLRLARDAGDLQAEGRALFGLAVAYEQAGRTTQALDHYWQALDLAKSHGLRAEQINVLFKVGLVYQGADDLANARRCLSEVVRLSAVPRFSSHPTAYEAHEALSRICETQGDLAGALAHYREYHRLERERNSRETHGQMAAVVIKLEVEKSQREAEIERLRRVELARANAALREADQEKSRLLDQLRAQATEDGLTGLFNRRYLEEALKEMFAAYKASGVPLTVALADLDDFKAVNDRFGHRAGDAVLRVIGGILREEVHPPEIAARYGGEEFALALPGLSIAAALPRGEAIRRRVEDYPWHQIAPGLAVTLSIGMCDDLSEPHHERLLSRADDLLYQVKRAGKNRALAR